MKEEMIGKMLYFFPSISNSVIGTHGLIVMSCRQLVCKTIFHMMLVSFTSHAKLCYLLTGTVSVKSKVLRMNTMICLMSSFLFFFSSGLAQCILIISWAVLLLI
uniref:Uncharacterized protein n=1 Tax=Arundo donax TaxID=35708 RepID=A0A0A9HA70_ARUDO